MSFSADRRSPTLRALIVDDEYPAREELRFLLRHFPEVEVVGEAAQASEAMHLIREIEYDLCFLDIKMPGGSGLELVKELSRVPHRPAVIFVTAYPDHAVEAFDLDAVDYLLKPFDEARLARALQRFIERDADSTEESSDAESARFDKIPVPAQDRTILLEPEDVLYAVAAHGGSYVVTGSHRHLVPYSLAELERRLEGRDFFRTHRAYLLNLRYARAIEPDFAGALQVVLSETQQRVPVSRRQARVFKRLVGL
ncbi:MAG: LytR/AlgR family response regulator transcription factor [Actinomycetota bacterium]